MPTPRTSRIAAVCAGALAIAAYFLLMTGGGLRTGFSHDDLMNMYRAWVESAPRLLLENLCFFLFPTSSRPLGGLFYNVFFNVFGFDPLPYRIFLLAFLLANIFLVYALVRRLTGSREIAALTALVHGYHPSFIPLYQNTGTCYDIFCFFFYLWAFLFYIGIRQQGRLLRPLEQFGFLALMICALDSKEIAVTLPVMIALYEALYHPPAERKGRAWLSWLFHEARLVWWGALFDLAFILGKVYGRGGMAELGESGYHVHISAKAYYLVIKHDLNEVFMCWGTNALVDRNMAILFGILFLFAWRSRIRHYRFAMLFWLVGILPVSFIPVRGIYAIYIPLIGFDLCGVTILVTLRDWLFQAVQRLRRAPPSVFPQRWRYLTFAVAMVSLASSYYVLGAMLPTWILEESDQIGLVIHELHTQLPHARKGARILFLKDPFATAKAGQWGTHFIDRLLYRDDDIATDRAWLMPAKPDAGAIAQYDYVFDVDRGIPELVQSTSLSAGPPRGHIVH